MSGVSFRCQIVAVALLASAVSFAQQQPGNPGQPAPEAAPASAAQPASQAAMSASGGGTPQEKKTEAASDTSGESSLARLGASDLIEVSVYNVPELTTKARISNSGDVYLPLIDYVHVEGLTQEEAQALIEKRLSDGGFVRNPHVSIFIDEAASQGITILGEVTKPGIYPDIGDRRLYTIISQAGGFTGSASRKISIIRRERTDPIRIDLPRNLADDLSGNIEVHPGDTINIPKAPIIYVVGDVQRPSGLLVDNGSLTVLQALALAGGTNHTAKLGGVRLLRKGPAGMTETRIELKRMLEAKSPDVTLQADDILFIPVSGGRVLAAKTFDAAMAAATAVTIYSVHP